MKSFEIDLYKYFNVEKEGNGGKLTAYIPDVDGQNKKIRPAMLILPGGAYSFLSDLEKQNVALKFLSLGFASFTLEYSIKTAYPTPMNEGLMAVEYLRENSSAFGLGKIAVIGFSAGGHLAGLIATATCWEAEQVLKGKVKFSLPDAAVLCYPVITLKDGITHDETRSNITGGAENLYFNLSIENRVTKATPPLFIWHTAEDDCVSAENTLLLAQACSRAGVPFSIHIFENGWHGLNLCDGETDAKIKRVGDWVDLAVGWLATHGFIEK